jgi:hypothetical protein
MKVSVRDYKPIVIPPKLMVKETKAFSADTPYVAKLITRLDKKSYLENKLPCKLLCLEALKKGMVDLGGYRSLAEPLAGVGLAARVLDGGGKMHLNDYDEGCYKILKHNFPEDDVTKQDMFSMKILKSDVVFLDFNDFTLRRFTKGPYKEVVQRAMASAKKFVIINDCSVFYFRYGASSFEVYSKLLGLRITETPEYFRALREYMEDVIEGWYLVNVAYFRDTSFLLFAKIPSALKIEYVDKPKTTFISTSL